MTDLTPEEMGARIHKVLVENSARFHPKIIVYEGMAGWCASRKKMLEALERLGWWREEESWRPRAGVEFDIAYRELCEDVRPVPNMARENMQPLIEGGYPDSEVWFEQFGSYPELRIEGDALVFHAAPMTPLEHVRFLKDRAEAFYMTALRSNTPDIANGASSVARDLEQRAEEIGRENHLPTATGAD